MATHPDIGKLEKKITALSDALAHLGKGTDLKDPLRIIHNPGWTTPAEWLFAVGIIDIDAGTGQPARRLVHIAARGHGAVGVNR